MNTTPTHAERLELVMTYVADLDTRDIETAEYPSQAQVIGELARREGAARGLKRSPYAPYARAITELVETGRLRRVLDPGGYAGAGHDLALGYDERFTIIDRYTRQPYNHAIVWPTLTDADAALAEIGHLIRSGLKVALATPEYRAHVEAFDAAAVSA